MTWLLSKAKERLVYIHQLINRLGGHYSYVLLLFFIKTANDSIVLFSVWWAGGGATGDGGGGAVNKHLNGVILLNTKGHTQAFLLALILLNEMKKRGCQKLIACMRSEVPIL
jgi:hypothetical protein